MGRPIEYGEGSFGILITGNQKDEIRWYHTKPGRDEALKAMKEISGKNMKFSKVSRLG